MSATTTQRPALTGPKAQMTAAEAAQVRKMVAKDAGGGKVSAFFEANKASMAALLPAHMTPDRFLRITMNALRTTPKLMDCTIESLFGAAMFCAQVGLEPNTPQQHIYLIPFANKRKNRTEVQVIIGYQGMLALARNTGEIESLMARAVYSEDEFVVEFGLDEKVRHVPKMDGDRGAFVGAYAIAKFKDGGHAFDFMPRAEIEKIRDGSQGYRAAKQFGKSDTPWIAHFDQMARKTAVRRLAKYLPMSIEMAATVALDERADRRQGQGMSRILDSEDFSVVAQGEDDSDRPDDEDPAPEVKQPQQDRPQQQAIAEEQKQPDQVAEGLAKAEQREPEPIPQEGEAKPEPKRQAAPKPAKPAPKASEPDDNLDFGA